MSYSHYLEWGIGLMGAGRRRNAHLTILGVDDFPAPPPEEERQARRRSHEDRRREWPIETVAGWYEDGHLGSFTVSEAQGDRPRIDWTPPGVPQWARRLA